MPDLIPAAQMKILFPDTSDQFWAALRFKGTGPTFQKVGRKVYYSQADVDAWLAANRYTRTGTDRPVTVGAGP